MQSPQIRREFSRYAALGILSMVALSCYILADTFFIANGVGADGLTALNFALPVFTLMHGLGLMIGIGSGTRFSISRSDTIFTYGLSLALSIGVLLLAVGALLSRPLAILMGAEGSLIELTAEYMRTFLYFAPMFMLNNLIKSFVQNDNNSRLVTAAMIIGSIANILLDYLFVFPMGMGMFGAALATGFSPIISLLILSPHFLLKKNTFHIRRIKAVFRPFGDIAALGFSAFINEVAYSIVIVVFNMIILNISGNLGIAAYGVVVNIAFVITSIFSGLSQGMQPLISRLHGSGHQRATWRILLYGVLTASVISLLVYTISFLFTEPIVAAFNRDNDPLLAAFAEPGLRIYFTAFLFMGFNILSATFFSSADQPKNAFLLSIFRGFIVIIPVTFLLSRLMGMTGVWLTTTVTEVLVVLLSIVMLLRFRAKTIK